MARIRTIKPEFFMNDEIASLPALDRLLFIGLWTQADRAGRLEDRPARIKAAILPYDEHDVDAALTHLQEKKVITRYQNKGGNYIEIINFLKHQYPNVKELESTIPAPYQHHTSTPRLRKGKERKGKEIKEKKVCAGEEEILPDWLPEKPWQDFLEMREAKKKPPTEKAVSLLLEKLDRWRKQGRDPTEILNASTVNGWTDIYEPKEKNGTLTKSLEATRTPAGGVGANGIDYNSTSRRFED